MTLKADWRPATLALVLILVTLVALLRPMTPPPAKEPAAPVRATLPAIPLKNGQLAAEWRPTGGPYEQVIYTLALGPSPKVLYAGTWGNGLYRSDNGGEAWQATSPPGDQGLVVDPTKAQVHALAVTPDGKTVYLSRWNAGVFRSTDYGVTWEGISGPANNILPFHDDWNVGTVLIDQDTPPVVYQATWGGVYKSTDGGDFWEHKDVDPDVPWEEKRVHALIQAEDGTLYAGTLGAGVYRSVDGGETWQAMGPREPALARKVYSLATQEGVVWAGTLGAGVYRTADSGQQWQQVITGFADDPHARTVQALALDREGNLYAGTVDFGVYRSEGGGDTWRPYNDGLRGYALAILSLVYDDRVDTLYAATYGAGVYRNVGDGWESISGVDDTLPAPAFEVQSLAFAGPEWETLLVGTFMGGVYASNDRGQSWRRWPRALPIGAARNVADIVVLDGGRTIVLAGGTGIYRSADGGESWKRVEAGLPEGDHRVLSLVQGKRNPAILFAALEEESGVGIYRSTDGGAEWERFGQLNGVDDLALSGDGRTLFALQLGQGLFRGDDRGISGPPLDSGITQIGRQIVVAERNAWQRLILGFARQSLHVRTLDGIYSSFDGGNSWRSSLRGQFETLLADPERPGVLYAAAMTDTVPSQVTVPVAQVVPTSEAQEVGPSAVTTTDLDQKPEFETQVVPLSDTPQYTFWVSLDDGRSWGQTEWGQTGDPGRPLTTVLLTVLALDPLDHNRLLAGTPDDGVYYTTLYLPSPYTTGRALLGLAAFVIMPALVLGALLPLYLYFLLGLRLRLYPWQVWALIFRIPAWRLVSTPRSELGSLEQLIASVATSLEAPFSPDVLWNELQSLGVTPSLTRVQNALSGLQARRLFTRDNRGSYRFALTALARLAALNFDRDALIDEVRSANRILRNAETFFDQAGFQVVVLLNRLFLWPESPHYRALGWLNVWLHIHQPLDEADVAELANNTDSGSRDLGFVVLDHIPTPSAYRAMQAARLIPLSSSEIQQAVTQREAGLTLERAIREGQGQEDLFDRWEPLLDHIGLFGRTETLKNWLTAIEQDQIRYYWGLPRSGRTSALWWLWTRVPGRWLRGYVDLRFRALDWPSILRDLLADLLLDLRQTHSRLWTLPELDNVLSACGPDLDLGVGLNYLARHGRSAFAPRFVFFLDGARPGAVLDRFQELADRRDDVSLLVSWDGLPSDPTVVDGDGWLPPLTPAESHALLKTIGARLGLDFNNDDLNTLDRAAGGHPFLLRQLGSQVARMAGRPDEASAHQVFKPGEWPDPLELERFPAKTAVQAYLQQHSDTLMHLWRALPPEVQRNVRLLAAGEPLDPDLEPAYTAMGLLTKKDESGAPHLRIGLVDNWLRERQL